MSMNTDKKGISKMQIRVKIQELLYNNMKQVNGRFDTKELNESAFVTDLMKNFDLIPVEKKHIG